MAKCAVCGKIVYSGVVVEKECLDALRRSARTGPDGLGYRPYRCPECGHEWLEDCDAADYPNYCPACGVRQDEGGGEEW